MADPLTYREVTGLWTVRVPDGPDTDQYPDAVPLAGRVVFTPNYRKPLVYPGEHVIVEPINAVLVDGVLMAESLDGENITLGPLFLPVTVDERADQTWAWEMSFHDLRLGEYGEEVTLPKVRFQIPEGTGPIDLSAVAPASSSGGVITLRGPRGYGITDITADSGVVTVEWEGGADVTIPIPTAALATPTSDGLMPKGDKAKLDGIAKVPVRFDTTAGTTVYVNDGTTERLVTGNTGPRLMPQETLGSAVAEDNTGTMTLQRVGYTVIVTLSAVRLRPSSGSTNLAWGGLPPGFRSVGVQPLVFRTTSRNDPVLHGSVGGDPGQHLYFVATQANFTSAVSTATNGHTISGTATFTTADDWPTILPGTPA